MYLYDIKYNEIKDWVKLKVLSGTGFRIGIINADFLNTKVNFMDDSENVFCISEFPGNCSALVVHCLQDYNKEMVIKIVNIAIGLCIEFEYAILYVSGSDDEFKEIMIEMGFVPFIEDLYNPHSGNNNFFACKTFDYKEK